MEINYRIIGKIILCVLLIAILVIYFGLAFSIRKDRMEEYNKALELIDNEEYIEAEKILLNIVDFKGVVNTLNSIKHNIEEERVYYALNNKDYTYVINNLNSIINEDKRLEVEQQIRYEIAMQEYSRMNYGDALNQFINCNSYLDSDLYVLEILKILSPKYCEILYNTAIEEYKSGDIENAIQDFELLTNYNYKDSEAYLIKCNETIELNK